MLFASKSYIFFIVYYFVYTFWKLNKTKNHKKENWEFQILTLCFKFK